MAVRMTNSKFYKKKKNSMRKIKNKKSSIKVDVEEFARSASLSFRDWFYFIVGWNFRQIKIPKISSHSAIITLAKLIKLNCEDNISGN